MRRIVRDNSALLSVLSHSRFRASFRLTEQDRVYIAHKGMETIRSHALDFVSRRITPGRPAADGKQTPFRGHPVFKAQHATATCCRKCLEKWHRIPRGRDLAAGETAFIVDLIMAWITAQQTG